MDAKLLIIADDLGLNSSVNDGIIYALNKELITGASIMANGEEFDGAIQKIGDLKNAKLGIHLVLVEEKPLVFSNVTKNHKIFFIKYILGFFDLKDIERELNAQIKKCKKAGVNPLFLNSHQHLHLLPKITNIVIKLAKENNIKYIRTVSEPFSLKAGLFRGVESLFLSLLSNLARRKIKKAGLETNDIFIGFLGAGNLQKEDIHLTRNLSTRFLDKTIELGCHLGYEDDKLRKRYKHWGNYNWQMELELIEDVLTEKSK